MNRRDFFRKEIELRKNINNFFESIISFFSELRNFESAIHQWKVKYVINKFPELTGYKYKKKFISIDENRDVSKLFNTKFTVADLIRWKEEIEFMSMIS